MRRLFMWTFLALALLALVFLLGPRATVVEEWETPRVGEDPEAYLARVEAAVPDLRPGEAKAVVWADPTERSRTTLALVYLHGFSADRHELDPVPAEVARRLGANLYHARLTGHGRDGDAMAEASVQRWFGDVAEAMEVAGTLGDRVVLMGTSTGGTLALWAAGQERWHGRITGLVLVSPNLGLRDPGARVLLWPWGRLIARVVVGPERCFRAGSPAEAAHWTTCYPTRALLPMVALAEHAWTMPLEEITIPTLVLHAADDRIVDPARTREAFARLGSRAKRLVAVDTDDPAGHVLAGDILSPGTNERVTEEIVGFLSLHARSVGHAP